MTAGASLEESVALIAAANKVVQDPNSVGSALRTISLRLRGTSVEILEEMGEETEGVIESTSKLQEKIKSLSGVDILSTSGDYRNPYEILKDIAEVYDDMEGMDQAALIELIAGKNRANTLAAILTNFEDLEGAYESALDAEGSAMRENEAYLDSIQGRIDLFNNAVQTMWMNFMNDDAVKFIVDLGTSLVQLVDTIGIIPTAVGAFAAFKLVAKSVSKDFEDIGDAIRDAMNISGTDEVVSEVATEVADHINDITQAQQENIDVAERVAEAKEAQADATMSNVAAEEAENAVDQASTVIEAQETAEIENNTSAQLRNTDANIQNAASDAQDNGLDATGATIESQETAQIKQNTRATIANTVAQKAGNAIKTLGKGLLFGLGVGALTALAGVIMGAIDDAIHENERAIERADEALNKYRNDQEDLKKQKGTVDELSDSYTRLSSGVNTLTNDNIGLTVDAYNEYLDVCNQIAEMYPELVQGYDAQGNAILNLTGKVDGLTDAYRHAQEEAANTLLTSQNKKDIWKKYESDAIVGTWVDDATYYEDLTVQHQKDVLEAILSMGHDDLKQFVESDAAGTKEMWTILKKQLEANGASMDTDLMYSAFNQTINLRRGSDKFKSVDNYKNYVNQKLSEVNQAISKSMSGIRDVVSADLIFNQAYQNLDEGSQGIVKAIINNMDVSMIAKSGAENADQFIDWFSSNVISQVADNQEMYSGLTTVSNKMAEAIFDKDTAAFTTAQSEFNKMIKNWVDESDNVVVDPDADVVTKYFQQLARDMQNEAKNYEVQVQIQTDVVPVKTIDEVLSRYSTDVQEQAKMQFDDFLGLDENDQMSDVFKKISVNLDDGDGKLRANEINDIYQDFLDNDMSDWSTKQQDAIRTLDVLLKLYGTDMETFIATLIELGYAYESLEDIPSFDLASESINEDIDKFQESIESVRDAWESLNSGDITKSDFIDLAQEFPELMAGVNLSDDNWMIQAKANLEALNATTIDNFIAELNKMKEAMAARGEDTTIVDSFIGYAEQLRDMPPVADELQANTITGLTEAYETYKTIMEETNEVIYNGQKVSDGYYDSLKEYIDDTDALNACFDENNKQIVTNVDALKELIAKQKEADINSAKLAKTQAQLEYYNLVRQLGDAARDMGGFEAGSDAANNALMDKIGTIKNAINQYQQLEDSLLGTTSAFEKFAKAQEMDEQNTYGASYIEMAQAMYDAIYKTGEVGSAQFWAAVEATVPDNIYQNLTPGPEQIKAISDYLNQNVFSTLTLDEESFSIDYSAMESFVKKAQKAGVFFGTDEKNFGLSADFIYGLEEGENALEKFAEQIGMTVPQVYAMLSELDKYTADGTGLSMLLQLDQSTAGQITYVTSLLERLYTAGDFKAHEAEIAKYEAQLAGLQKQATDAVKAYAADSTAIETALADTSKSVSDVFSRDLIVKIGLEGNETVQEALIKIKGYQQELKEPTVVELEIAKQNIEDEIAGIVESIGKQKLKANVTLNEDTGLYEVKDGTLTVDASTLERYVELMNASTFIDESLSSALTTSEQLLSSIDANVSKIAGADSPSEDGGEETTQNEESQEDNTPLKTEGSKPMPDTYPTDTKDAINNFMHRVMDQIVSYPNAKNIQQQHEYDELNKIYKRAQELRDGINDLTIFPEDAYAEFSELQTQAKKFGVEIPVYLDPNWVTVDIDEEGAKEAEGITETTEAVDDLNNATQSATSETEALMQAYASNREVLATLEAMEDKTRALTEEEALALGFQLNDGEVLTVEAAINRIKRAQEELSAAGLYNPEQEEEASNIIYTYSQLAEQLTNYSDILTQTQEIISDGTEVSQEYKDSLEDLGLTTEEIGACFEDNNELVVTNAKMLNNLVKNSKKNVATNIKLAKSQAQLEYYELYKEIAKLTDGTQVTDKATLNYINSLYSQMGAVEQTIAKYSMLEAKLLGATNAYDKLAEAQAFDSETDYGSKAEELVNVLANAFNTAELGTQAAQVAIAGLIPDEVIDKTKSLDDQMQQIYDYFTQGKVSKLFTIEFDDDGGISSVEMTKENVESFTKELIGAGKVFHGTWDEFTLDESITSLDDFAKAIGTTKEVAFAYLTELEKYDINWLGGDYETLLDQLMGDDLEYGVQKTTQKLAQLRKEIADLQEGGIDDTEKQRIKEIEGEIDKLNGKMDEHRATAHNTWQEYAEIDNVLADTSNLGKKVSAVFSSDLIAKVGLTGDETVEEAYDRLLAYQLQLGEPTELILQLASEHVEEEIADLKTELEKEGIDVNANVKLNPETGEWEVTGDTTNTKLQEYATLLNKQQTLESVIADSLASTEENVAKAATAAERTAVATESMNSIMGGENASANDAGTKNSPSTGRKPEFTLNAHDYSDEADSTDSSGAGSENSGTSRKQKYKFVPLVYKDGATLDAFDYSDTGGSVLAPGAAYVDPGTMSGGEVEAEEVVIETPSVSGGGGAVGGIPNSTGVSTTSVDGTSGNENYIVGGENVTVETENVNVAQSGSGTKSSVNEDDVKYNLTPKAYDDSDVGDYTTTSGQGDTDQTTMSDGDIEAEQVAITTGFTTTSIDGISGNENYIVNRKSFTPLLPTNESEYTDTGDAEPPAKSDGKFVAEKVFIETNDVNNNENNQGDAGNTEFDGPVANSILALPTRTQNNVLNSASDNETDTGESIHIPSSTTKTGGKFIAEQIFIETDDVDTDKNNEKDTGSTELDGPILNSILNSHSKTPNDTKDDTSSNDTDTAIIDADTVTVSESGGGDANLYPVAYEDPATMYGGDIRVDAVSLSTEEANTDNVPGDIDADLLPFADLSTLGELREAEGLDVEVDLDTEEAEEKIDEIEEQTKEAFTVEEILINEGLDGLPLDKAFLDTGFNTLDGLADIMAFDTTIFTQVLTEAGYTEEQINSLIGKIQEYKGIVLSPSNPDPLGLNQTDTNIDALTKSLDELGITYSKIDFTLDPGTWFDGESDININAQSLVDALKAKGWTDEAIKSYCQQLSNSAVIGVSAIDFGGMEAVEAYLQYLNDLHISDKTTDVEVKGAEEAEEELNDVNAAAGDVTKIVTTKYVTEYHTVGSGKNETVRTAGSGGRYTKVNGTAHAQGTAHKGGSWGAPKTETALTGELGPELRVRGNRWELLGENGAEFNEVRKGDIIFNHKQTEQLLTNGYITGRGKAFAEGTVGGSAFAGIDTWDDSYGKFNKSYSNTAGEELSDAVSGAADDISDAADEFREVFDWIEVRLEEINEDISLKGAELENAVGSSAQNAVIDDMIALNKKLYENLTAGAAKYDSYAQKLLTKIPEEYRKAAQDGSIAIEEFVGEVDEETLNAIQEYREWVQKGADVTQQAEETLTEISNLAKQAIDNIAQDYENKMSFGNSRIEQLEAFNSLTETDLGYESASIYQAMIEENNRNIAILQDQRNAMLAELNKRVESGEIKRGSQDWYDAINEIAAVDTEIVNLKTDTENYQDAINNLHWDKFDSLINRLQSVSEEAENLIDILGNSDLVDDAGNWTDEGIASLGLYAQQMEAAEAEAKKYQDEINYLNDNWQELGYTEDEYLERLGELKDGQYAAIQSYHKSKDAIVDMTKARVDAIKKGIEEEIEAYEELISKKKEELDAEKDLYDFQKNVAGQQKNIAELQRKIAALSADNSASARAKRAQLEAELAEAQQELADTYYDRSVSNQQEALDKEMDAFREEKDKEMEGWDEYLEDTNQVVADGLATVQENTATVYKVLQDMGKEYGLSITESLTSPWKAGENAIDSFTGKFGDSMSATVDELKELEVEFIETMANIELSGKDVAETVNDNFKEYKDAKKNTNKPGDNDNDGSSAAGLVSGLSGNIQYGQSGANVKNLQKALNALGFNCGSVDGVFGDKTYAAVVAFQKSSKFGGAISADGIVGKNTKKKFKIAGYAGGTTGVKNNQWALIDELGEELVIRPSKGRMTFLEKGSAVVPTDLTSNLMEWGELDPSIMLERNKPVISAPHITNNNMEINMEISEVVHIDTVTNDTIPNLTKAIEKQMDKYMKNVNNNIRKYAR